jgi:hypothetical protein
VEIKPQPVIEEQLQTISALGHVEEEESQQIVAKE